MYLCLYACVHMNVHVGSSRRQKRASGPMEPELQMAVGQLIPSANVLKC